MKTSVSFYIGYTHRKTNFFNGEFVTCVFNYNEDDHIWSFPLNLDNKQACNDLISSFDYLYWWDVVPNYNNNTALSFTLDFFFNFFLSFESNF